MLPILRHVVCRHANWRAAQSYLLRWNGIALSPHESQHRNRGIFALVGSLAKPGGNVTGMSLMFPELAAKRLNLLTQAVPGISRVLVLTYLADPIAHLQVQALQKTASALGVTLQIQDIRASDDLLAAFERV